MTTLDRAEVVLGANDRELRTGLARARQATRSAGRQMRNIVNRIGRAFAAAFATAGAAATKFAGDFQEEMSRLETLVGISSDSVAEFRNQILQLAPAVGRSPQELSKAMFAITSGGLRGAEAMETLRQSAKASAIGLGDTTQIGRTATAALQAFGDQGLSATEAIDQMVATVRAGNLEAQDLSGSLGRVMGIASTLGVRFSDMNAFIATFTRLGVGAREATTSLRSILQGLTGANQQAATAFQELGIPMREVRRTIQEEGLVAGLQQMIDATGGNVEALSEIVPNIRALSGFLGTAGAQSEEFAKVQGQVRDALGLTNEGFERARQNLNFVRDQVIQVAKVIGIRLAQDAVGDLRAFGNEVLNNSNRLLQFGRIVTTAVGIAASAFRTGLGVIRMFLQDIGERIGALGAAVAFLFEGEFTAAGEAAKEVVGGFSEETVSRFEDVQDSAEMTRQRISELRKEVEELRTMPARSIAGMPGEGGEGETQSGISFTPTTPAISGGIGGGFRPQSVGRGGIVDPQQLANDLGIQWERAGEDGGDSFMDGMGRRLKQGAQSAMQALLSGLLRGKQNMEETLARIGISIASTLLTQGLFSGLGIASPAKEGVFAGEMLAEGLAVGMENTVRRVRQAASSVAVTAASAAATGGASVATPGAAGSVSARDGVIDASKLDPMGQVAAHVAMESPSLQRLFTAGTDDARKRRGER